MTKVIMHGCNGKMGQTITAMCKDDPEIEIVAGIDLYDGIKNDYPVFPNISVCDVKADAVIDFSNAKAVDDLLIYCEEKQVPVVLCTTGLSEEQLGKSKTGQRTCGSFKISQYVTRHQYADGTFEKGGFNARTGRFRYGDRGETPQSEIGCTERNGSRSGRLHE